MEDFSYEISSVLGQQFFKLFSQKKKKTEQ